MSQLTIKKEGNGFAVARVGNLAAFSGKAFLKDAMSLTGVEVSFGTLAPGEAVPFNHKHKQNVEVFIVLSGTGGFTLDGEDFAVESGDALRTADCPGHPAMGAVCQPASLRGGFWRNGVFVLSLHRQKEEGRRLFLFSLFRGKLSYMSGKIILYDRENYKQARENLLLDNFREELYRENFHYFRGNFLVASFRSLNYP